MVAIVTGTLNKMNKSIMIKYELDKGIKFEPLKGVIFDMDGTLTVPAINFVLMRQRLGIPKGDVLSIISEYTPEKKKIALDIIEVVEAEGRANMKIQPGAADLVKFLQGSGYNTGLITRNSTSAISYFSNIFGFLFNPAISRDFQPCKPAPDSAIHICNTWNIDAKNILFVGDYADDVTCGQKAGTATCLLENFSNTNTPEWRALCKPDLHVKSLLDLLQILHTGEIVVRR